MSPIAINITSKCSPTRDRRAFTLIELLVVMAVIAVLASILIPSVSSVQRHARCTLCAANERVLAGAVFAYISDNSGYLPIPSLGWEPPGSNGQNVAWAMDGWGAADFNVGTLWPYVAPTAQARAKVLWCPSDDLECLPTVGGVTQYVTRNFSYSLNSNIRWNYNSLPAASLALRRVTHPDQHVMVYEEFGLNDGICFRPNDADDYLSGRHGPIGSTNYLSHRANYWTNDGSGNVAYFDGHVGLMSVKYYFGTPSQWGPLTN